MSATYILGGAQTDFSRNWTKEGKTFMSMMREVVDDGLREVGLDYDEIIRLNKDNRIAVFVGNFDAEQYANQGHLGAFLTEVNPAFFGVPGARYEAACASGSVALDSASAKIRAGDYDVGIVVGVEVMKTVSSLVGGDFLGTAAYYAKEAKGVSFPFPKLFGKLADEVINRYGSKVGEQRIMDGLGEISRINYGNAKNNPYAQTRSWFMNKEQATTRGGKFNAVVGGRLAISDCSQVTDGAALLVVASPKYAQEFSKKSGRPMKSFAQLKGWGHRVAPVLFTKKMEESKDNDYILPWTRQAVVDSYKRAGLDIDQIDVIETHDCFTSSEYASISAYGMTKPGEEHIAIEEGTISMDGVTDAGSVQRLKRKPVNPSGGLIGCGHPVGASGVRMALDLYKQVTDQANDYQVPGAKNGLMLNIGGSATTNYTFVIGSSEG
ncbi:MAG: thiolase domain-containing protein [Leptonema sp. (in: Bacteria)]|nr:thiolase domain-containing protein [Leptonema sp. (in: bacteria)]